MDIQRITSGKTLEYGIIDCYLNYPSKNEFIFGEILYHFKTKHINITEKIQKLSAYIHHISSVIMTDVKSLKQNNKQKINNSKTLLDFYIDCDQESNNNSFNKFINYHKSNCISNSNPTDIPQILINIQNFINELALNEINKNKINELLKLPQPDQLSEAWYKLRNNMFTASSDISVIVEQSYDHKTASTVEEKKIISNTLLLKKNGIDLKKFTGNKYTLWGQKYEQVVNNIYECKNNIKVIEFGLLQHPEYPFIGASPDGITEHGRMIEIKCPQLRKINGTVPIGYWIQIQTQLEVTNLEKCDFVEAVFKEYTRDSILNYKGKFSGCIGQLYRCTCNEINQELRCNCFIDDFNRKYIYPDISQSISAQIDEIHFEYNIKFSGIYKFDEIIYWGLEQYSNVLVTRDNSWWATNVNKFIETWDKVLYYRNNPKELTKLHESTIKDKAQLINNKRNFGSCIFLDD